LSKFFDLPGFGHILRLVDRQCLASVGDDFIGHVWGGLNKVDGTIANIELSNSETQTMGRLEITLRQCRYPADDPAGDAYALLLIREDGEKVFEGWMVASSPALNALEHPRYDIWVMRCKTA